MLVNLDVSTNLQWQTLGGSFVVRSLRFGVHMEGKAAAFVCCRRPGPKASQVQCAVGDSAKRVTIGILDMLVNLDVSATICS